MGSGGPSMARNHQRDEKVRAEREHESGKLKPMATLRRNDESLLREFEERTLPYDEWTHMSHVRVGFLYVYGHRFDQAVGLMREGIQKYNQANANRVRMGYHETITVAFLRLIAARIEKDAGVASGCSIAFCERHPELLDQRMLERHYSRELLFSDEARSNFVPPDLSQVW